VFFCEHKLLYPVEGDVPDDEYLLPFGVADVKREGSDVTVVATMFMVHKAITAAEILQKEGVNVEIVDPRTLTPLDTETICKSAKKTGRVVIVSEDCRTAGVSAEIAAIIAEKAIDYLDAPVKRVTAYDSPIPFSPPLEQFIIPTEQSIVQAVKEMI
jgi:pyruvate/2-oxoglutarate/acetoin dehydrogenase E1 component